jgi:hypothetical protein
MRYDGMGPFSRFQRFLWNRKMFRRANDRSITVHGSPFSATCNKVGQKSRARAIYEGVERGVFKCATSLNACGFIAKHSTLVGLLFPNLIQIRWTQRMPFLDTQRVQRPPSNV